MATTNVGRKILYTLLGFSIKQFPTRVHTPIAINRCHAVLSMKMVNSHTRYMVTESRASEGYLSTPVGD